MKYGIWKPNWKLVSGKQWRRRIQLKKRTNNGEDTESKGWKFGEGSLFTAGSKGSQSITHGRRKRRRRTVSWCKKKNTTSSAQTEGEVGQEERAQKAEKRRNGGQPKKAEEVGQRAAGVRGGG